MKILGINGSHRVGKGSSQLLQLALKQLEDRGANVEMVELAEYEIEFCLGCNACMRKPLCAIDDCMTELMDKMKEADGIIIASPNYFANVPARLKNFMDRTRCLHMISNQLKGKVAGIITTTGLSNCGVEGTYAAIERYFNIQQMLIATPRPEGPVLGQGITATQWAGLNDDGTPKWRHISDDPVAAKATLVLADDMYDLISRLS